MLEVATLDQLRGHTGGPEVEPEQLCEGSVSLSTPTAAKGAAGDNSQQLDIMFSGKASVCFKPTSMRLLERGVVPQTSDPKRRINSSEQVELSSETLCQKRTPKA